MSWSRMPFLSRLKNLALCYQAKNGPEASSGAQAHAKQPWAEDPALAVRSLSPFHFFRLFSLSLPLSYFKSCSK